MRGDYLSREEQAFFEALYKYMKDRNTPIERIPSLGFKQCKFSAKFTIPKKLCQCVIKYCINLCSDKPISEIYFLCSSGPVRLLHYVAKVGRLRQGVRKETVERSLWQIRRKPWQHKCCYMYAQTLWKVSTLVCIMFEYTYVTIQLQTHLLSKNSQNLWFKYPPYPKNYLSKVMQSALFCVWYN